MRQVHSVQDLAHTLHRRPRCNKFKIWGSAFSPLHACPRRNKCKVLPLTPHTCPRCNRCKIWLSPHTGVRGVIGVRSASHHYMRVQGVKGVRSAFHPRTGVRGVKGVRSASHPTRLRQEHLVQDLAHTLHGCPRCNKCKIWGPAFPPLHACPRRNKCKICLLHPTRVQGVTGVRFGSHPTQVSEV